MKHITEGQHLAEDIFTILSLTNTPYTVGQALLKLPMPEEPSLIIQDQKPENTLFLETVQIAGISVVKQAPDGTRKSVTDDLLMDFLCGCLGEFECKKKSIGTVRRNLKQFIEARSQSKKQKRHEQSTSASKSRSKFSTQSSSKKSIFQIGRRPNRAIKFQV